jgi:hypothetical protein
MVTGLGSNSHSLDTYCSDAQFDSLCVQLHSLIFVSSFISIQCLMEYETALLQLFVTLRLYH